MAIEDYFVEGEEILAQAGSFYASNKRLLRYKKLFKGEELDDIPYSHITSIGVIRNTRRGLVKAGIIIAMVGLLTLLAVLAIRPALKSVSDLLGSAAGSQPVPGVPLVGVDLVALVTPLIPFSVVALALGVVMTTLGVLLPQTFIQFRAPGLKIEAEAKFRLSSVDKETSLNLVRTVRQLSMAKESDPVKVRLPENRGGQKPGPQTS